jgi:hypothetical protein
MDTSDFNFIFLGQSVLKYQVPLDVYQIINHIYETKYPELKPANKQLVGKIEKEHSLEYSSPDSPQNGRLQILGSASGMFANIDYQPDIKERDFFIFPYDMRHCVYPFNGPGMRRTLAANMDVQYDPIRNRGVS